MLVPRRRSNRPRNNPRILPRVRTTSILSIHHKFDNQHRDPRRRCSRDVCPPLFLSLSPSFSIPSPFHLASPPSPQANKPNNQKPSLKTLASTLQEPYDLIFIDADKSSYPTYLSLILSLSPPLSSLSTSQSPTRLLKPTGIILADNVLRRGLVADSSPANPWAARMKEEKGLVEFNEGLVGSERVEAFLMPLFDGVGCGRLVD